MTDSGFFNMGRLRPLLVIAVTVLHVIVIVYVNINIKSEYVSEEPMIAGVMKLVDVKEEEKPAEGIPQNVQPALAETLIETDQVPPPVSAFITGPVAPVQINDSGTGAETYLPMHQISQLPVLPEDQIVRATVYPPIAQRSNIEGSVYLELFIDRFGYVKDVRILKETPPDRGFGTAAVNAFRGIKGKPAEANGQAVAVRYRYNINFKLN